MYIFSSFFVFIYRAIKRSLLFIFLAAVAADTFALSSKFVFRIFYLPARISRVERMTAAGFYVFIQWLGFACSYTV